MNIREELQEKAKNLFVKSNRKEILYLACRFGKTSVALKIAEDIGYERVVVSMPRLDIKNGWLSEIERLDYKGEVIFTTFLSLHKHLESNKKQLIIIDECQEFSDRAMDVLQPFVAPNDILALSGTLTNSTQAKWAQKLGITVCYQYLIDEAVKDGVICDYSINIHKIPLDNRRAYIKTKGKYVTEKRYFDSLEHAIKVLKEKKKPWKFLELKIISLLQNSISKLDYTKKLLKQYKDERVLVFCGLTSIADSLGIPSYHSKSKSDEEFLKFCNGEEINQMATVRMAEAGITVRPINRVILNYSSGASESFAQKCSRVLGLEWDNPDKKAHIDLVTTNEPFDLQRVNTATQFFDKSKTNYI